MTSFDSSFTSDASQSPSEIPTEPTPDRGGASTVESDDDVFVPGGEHADPHRVDDSVDESSDDITAGLTESADEPVAATDERALLAADPDIPEAFRDVVARLDEVPGRDVTDHAEVYDAVHRDLRAALDGIERG